MGWLFHAMELPWFLKIRNSFCLRLIGRNFWGDFWGWMGCGVPCGRASPVQCRGDYWGPLYLLLSGDNFWSTKEEHEKSRENRQKRKGVSRENFCCREPFRGKNIFAKQETKKKWFLQVFEPKHFFVLQKRAQDKNCLVRQLCCLKFVSPFFSEFVVSSCSKSCVWRHHRVTCFQLQELLSRCWLWRQHLVIMLQFQELRVASGDNILLSFCNFTRSCLDVVSGDNLSL